MLFMTSLHYLTIHIPEVIHLNYLSHLPIIYVASTFLVLGWLMTGTISQLGDVIIISVANFVCVLSVVCICNWADVQWNNPSDFNYNVYRNDQQEVIVV